jgi:hypothetical protein
MTRRGMVIERCSDRQLCWPLQCRGGDRRVATVVSRQPGIVRGRKGYCAGCNVWRWGSVYFATTTKRSGINSSVHRLGLAYPLPITKYNLSSISATEHRNEFWGETFPLCVTNIINMKWNSSLNTTNGFFLSQDGVRLSNYMFRPAFVAIVRLQSSSVNSLYNMLNPLNPELNPIC